MLVTQTYSVKRMSGGKARIYISSQSLLAKAKLKAGDTVWITKAGNSLSVKKKETPESQKIKVLSTSRGAILEIRNRDLDGLFKAYGRALVVVNAKEVVIMPHPSDVERVKTEKRFLAKLSSGATLKSGSLYSGMGMLSYSIHDGFSKAGVNSSLVFANDVCDKAADVNIRCNPVWQKSPENAKMVVGDIRELLAVTKAPKLDLLDISYPCNGQSLLADKLQRDIRHSVVGDLFIDTVAFIKTSRPALMFIECTPAFHNSDTLMLIKKSLPDFVWHHFDINGAEYGAIENRARACVVAISKGLSFLLDGVSEKIEVPSKEAEPLSSYLEDVPEDHSSWKPYSHVMKKVNDERLNFKHYTYDPTSTSIATIVATYNSPKIGSPFLRHPTKEGLFRLFQPIEHARIKHMPETIQEEIFEIQIGLSNLVTSRGSHSLAHRLLGMSVDTLPWKGFAQFIGRKMIANIKRDLVS